MKINGKFTENASTFDAKFGRTTNIHGRDGVTPHIGMNGNWYIGDNDTGVRAQGYDGKDGYIPVKGKDYFDGEQGVPGYTPQKGVDYFDGQQGEKGDPFTYEDFTPEQLASLKGDPGVSGVYVGSGDMPDGYNIQIDPDGSDVSNLVLSVNGIEPDENGNVEIEIGGVSVEGAVLYTPQTLTDEQKAQARENIGAAPMSLFNIIEGDDTPKLTSIMPTEDEFAVGKFIYHDTGNIIDSPNWRCVDDYIALPVGARLMTHYSASSTKAAYPYVVYYDENKTFIGSEDPGTLTQEEYDGKLCAFYNVPQNARFIRLSVPDNIFSLGYFGFLYLYTITEVKANGGVEIPNLIVPMDAIPNSDILVRGALPLMGKTIVNFGDSIFGNAQPPTDISTFLAEKTGATVYNCGFGGCRMSPHPTAEYHAFSMYKLADAISTGDFTEQENAVNSTTVTLNNAIKSNFATLKTIDFSKVDIVTIAYGANDFNGALLDNEENPLDVTTFGGALRYSIEKLLTAYPHLRIFVLSTTWRFWTNESNEYVDDSNTHTNGLGKLIADYNAKLKAVAEEYNLPFVDDYNIGIGKFNRSYYFNANDGAHHKETGRNAIAAHLAKSLW